MAAFSLRRFTKPETLCNVSHNSLLLLLSPYRDYFAGRGLELPVPGGGGALDHERLVSIFLTPDMAMPLDLVESLYLINELATPTGMDSILHEAKLQGIYLSVPWKATPMDVAVAAFIADREMLERIHHRHAMLKRRSFFYFRTEGAAPPVDTVREEAMPAFRDALHAYFLAHNRGRHLRTFMFHRDRELWLTVRHGDVFHREMNVEDGESVVFVYRPECFNTIVYNAANGEMRVHAGTDGEREMYRQLVGKHLFGSEFLFWGAMKYSCEPLRSDGPASLAVTDVTGIEWARLTEVKCEEDQRDRKVQFSRKSSDLFQATPTWRDWIPGSAQIVGASFKVKFRHARTPQTISLRPPNMASYSHDGDSALTEQWLRARGFICTGCQS